MQPGEVMEAGTPGPLALVVDCPSVDYLPALCTDPTLRRVQQTGAVLAHRSCQSSRQRLCWFATQGRHSSIVVRQRMIRIILRPLLQMSPRAPNRHVDSFLWGMPVQVSAALLSYMSASFDRDPPPA